MLTSERTLKRGQNRHMTPERKLIRYENDRFIAGVCSGLAHYIGMEVVWVRVAFFLLAFASGIGFAIYLLLWFIMPRTADTNLSGEKILQENAGEIGDAINQAGRANTIGIILILLGGFLLLNQLGVVALQYIWPFLLVGIGAYFLLRN